MMKSHSRLAITRRQKVQRRGELIPMDPTCLQLISSWIRIKDFLARNGYVHYQLVDRHLELFDEETERDDALVRLKAYLAKRSCNFKYTPLLSSQEKLRLKQEYEEAKRVSAEAIRRTIW